MSSGKAALLCRLGRGAEQKWLPAAAEDTSFYTGTAGVRTWHEAAQQEPPRRSAVPQEKTRLHLQSAEWNQQAGTIRTFFFQSVLLFKPLPVYVTGCRLCMLQRAEREKLMVEKSHLGQLKLKTCHSVSALCQRVCSEANLQPEQLQVFAKYASPGCPLSSPFPHIDALLSEHRLPVQVSGSSAGLDGCMLTGEAPAGSSRDTGEERHSL